MSKPNRGRGPQERIETAPVAETHSPEVPQHLRCPCCFGGLGGVGVQYGQYPPKNRLYLRCNRCGHTWTADVVVETTVVQVDHRLPDEIQTR